MGCFHSKEAVLEPGQRNTKNEALKKQYRKPKWKSQESLTPEKLQRMRDEFWDTQPHYGGDRVIWDAIKAALAAPDMETTKLIIEAAGIIVAKSDMTVMYDERGAKYDLPKYVISDPSNLAQALDERQQQGAGGQAQ